MQWKVRSATALAMVGSPVRRPVPSFAAYGSSELRELELGEGGFATAAFEVWLRELNQALRPKHRQLAG